MELDYQTAAKREDQGWNPEGLSYAEVDWSADTPVSREFGDVYYSKADGLAESRYVFLDGNGLPQRWNSRSSFTIGEFGFGTGLNFLATWDCWRKSAPQDSHLHYLAFESRPMREQDLARAHSAFPDLDTAAKVLRKKLPILLPGFHRIRFNDRVFLTLVYGSVEEFLPRSVAQVDAWYFDGFAPSRNEALWLPEQFRLAALISSPDASFATFSAATKVREALSLAGFAVRKREGFGKKREMLLGTLGGETLGEQSPGRVAVVGAGLAGVCVANSFAARGVEVSLIEKEQRVATQASGNAAAILMGYLSVKPDLLSRFNLNGYLYTLRLLQDLSLNWSQCGVLRLTSSARLSSLYEKLADLDLPTDLVREVDAAKATSLSGVKLQSPAIFYPSGGYVSPSDFCRNLLTDSGGRVDQLFGVSVKRVEREAEQWMLYDSNDQLITQAKTVVFANAFAAKHFASWLPLEKLRGQVHSVAATKESSQLKTVLCYDGYLMPAEGEQHFLGATYNHGDFSSEINDSHKDELVSRLNRWTSFSSPLSVVSGRVGFRTMSPDRLPLVGALAETTDFEQRYKQVNRGRFGRSFPYEAEISGLYLSVGHGSRGMLSCPLAAEIIAARVLREPMAIDRELLNAIHPGRFLIRAVKRGLKLETH